MKSNKSIDSRAKMLYRGFDLVFESKYEIHVYRCTDMLCKVATVKEAKDYVNKYLEPEKYDK